ncbi:hypothetical protein V6N13_091352 [Hibiscus sabdariffa]|uniref:Uncharacterized protein n=1 Tax=Hibiscus sabdariffa TaxID=183260 RepID=A0ABR2QE52_9ROSI
MSSETLQIKPQIQHDYDPSRVKQEDKEVQTMKALWSLTVAIVVPLSLTLFIIFEFGSAKQHRATMAKPTWFPPLLLINLASIWSSFSMSLAAWLVWVDHGFHMNSDALPLYISQVSLSIVWHPLHLVIGSVRFGFMEFRDINLVHAPPVTPRALYWSPPPPHLAKFNVDAGCSAGQS